MSSDTVASVSVEDVMAEDPVTIQEDAEAIEISWAINKYDVRRFPVDENGSLTGVVTLDDLVATIGEQLDTVANTTEVQLSEYSP